MSQIHISGENQKPEEYYALHVALQTLKERCQSLQQRLKSVEEENEILRKSVGLDRPPAEAPDANPEDVLRETVGELIRQKNQLSEHISMVATENRQLWSRLSKLTYANQSLGISISKVKDTINSNPTTSTNLIRSKTFTQHSPHPKFRDKDKHHTDSNQDPDNMSLEEISLQLINKLVEGKENFELKCGEILDNSSENLCFGFNNDSTEDGADLDNLETSNTIEKCTENAKQIRDALVEHKANLKCLIENGIKRKEVPQVCTECVRRKLQKTTVSIDSQTDIILEEDSSGTQQLINLDEEKRLADGTDRQCPLCGEIYTDLTKFELFQDHVEAHLLDESHDIDFSIEKNFDMISHSNF